MSLPRWAWVLLGVTAVAWPSRFVGPLDGLPLDGAAEALVIGLALPSLWWLTRRQPLSALCRIAMVTLLVWKAGTGIAAQQQGLCLRAEAPVPLDGTAMTMRVQEPAGMLRSWDVRADLWAERPACTAILGRAMPETRDFPAWFVNITDQMLGRREFTLAINGYLSTRHGGVLTLGETGDAAASGAIGGHPVSAPIRLEPGEHPVHLTLAVAGEAMRFDPRLDGESLWRAGTLTVAAPSTLDRWLAPWAWLVSPLLCLLLAGALVATVVRGMGVTPVMGAWMAAASAAAIVLAQPWTGLWPRAAGLLMLAAAAVPVRTRLRNLNGAFLLIGVPWLAFFAARSFDQIGRFSIFSTDDWLAYQVAGYRIFLNGFWIEGGTLAFDYQPLYRWMTGALHLVFGDSSVGEVYWDAAALLVGALLTFQIVRMTAGYRWGMAAAAAVLATFTLGTSWHVIGRGLSEIAAAGWAFLAMFFLLRGRRGSAAWVLAAALMAVLMFLTRLNHLLWAATLPVLLLALRPSASFADLRLAIPGIRWRRVALYAGAVSAALVLFMTRTWYFTGAFSLFHGTSLRHNDTGLRPWTIFDPAVWAKVSHSLTSLMWMNEPPRVDVRAVVMAAGFVIGVAALLQVPVARRVPGALVLAAAGATLGSLFAHAHGYPGRFSIHAVPLAGAMVALATARGWRG